MFAKEDLQRLTTLDALVAMSDRDFEYCCKYLLDQAGYGKAFVTKKGPKGGDGGVDLDLKSPDGTLIACGQCKCWKRRSSYNFMAPIRELAGSMKDRGVSRGIFLTTCQATDGEQQLARKLDIELIDGPAILRMVRTHILGLNAQPEASQTTSVSPVTMTRKLLQAKEALPVQESIEPAEESQAKVFFTFILMTTLIAMAVFAAVYVIQQGWWVWFAYGAFFLWVLQKLPESSVSGYSRRSYHRWRPHRRRWRSYSRW